MDVDNGMFVKVIGDNAKNNERLAIAIEELRDEVKEIHEKYRNFSRKMLVVELEMGFILILTAGILFKLMMIST